MKGLSQFKSSGKLNVAHPLHLYRTCTVTAAPASLLDGQCSRGKNGERNGERPPGTADQDRGEHERPFGGKLPRPGGASPGGGRGPDSVSRFLDRLGRHSGHLFGESGSGSPQKGRQGARKAPGAEAAVLTPSDSPAAGKDRRKLIARPVPARPAETVLQ